MAYAVVHHFPGGTKAQYDTMLKEVHPDNGRGLPKGQIFHAAGPSAGGWTIMAIHETKDSWERFRNETLMPKIKAGVKGGFTSPPQETVFEVHKLSEHKLAESSVPR